MASTSRARPLHIFLSFAYEDRAFRDALDTHLAALQKSGYIDNWHKHEVAAGGEWQNVVDEQLNQADIILLFITPHFIASQYCYSVQMKQALEKHEHGEARVIPILFRPTFWYDLPFAKLQGLPVSGNKTVSEWKNKDRAYVEIVEGIKKAIEELSERRSVAPVAPNSPASPLWHVPYQRNPFFTGREHLLLALRQTFLSAEKQTIQVQALSGLAGIGKTQIALEYAYRYRDTYQAVFWLKGYTPGAFLADLLSLATLLNLPEQKETDQQIVLAAIRRALAHLSNWLIVLDDLDSFDLLESLLPTRGQGHLLITTRRQASGTTAILHGVEKFSPDEGRLFLLRRAKVLLPNATLADLPDASRAEAGAIYQRVDGHPLALDQAGAYIEETHISLTRYAGLYDKHAMALLKERRKFATGHPASISTTLAMCISQARQENPASLELLAACAFLHPETIPLDFFTASASYLGPVLQALISDELAFNRALETLLDLSLLQRHSQAETLSLSRLVQTVMRGEMDAATQRLWAERTIKALSHIFPEAEIGVWHQCQTYLPHALLAANHIKQQALTLPEAARLLYLTARYLWEIASYTDALPLAEQALLLAEQAHSHEQAQIAHIHQCLGAIHESLGHYATAQQHYEQALTLGEAAWGSEDAETAQIWHELGEHFQTIEQFALAEEYYRRALAIRQKLFGLEHPDTASSLNNIAGICDEQGRPEQAEPLYIQALELRERLRGSQHPDTAESLSNLARFYRIRGKYREAQPLYERALQVYEQALGAEHPRVATCCNNFAVFCIALGQYNQAEQLLKRALEIRIQCFGARHPGVIGSQNHLARVYGKQGRYAEARALFEHILLLSEEQLGQQHSTTLAIRTNMGELVLAQGHYAEAEALLSAVLALMTALQEPGSSESARLFHLLGQIRMAQGTYEQAESDLATALDLRQNFSGKTHPETALVLKSLGDLASARGNDVQAAERYQEALASAYPPLDAAHPDVLSLATRLQELWRKQEREADAQQLAERLSASSPGEERGDDRQPGAPTG